ncbi:MAG: alpha/beta hydrolase [Herminiimonas sp.]|uniref:alpha/beta hydrolase n=1 Tax=Herminiimonas sp. TaxID=1926289 RepID=UPI00271A7726|nr:alpha/beta fold hydrolase [Herminiimonas sp.]MDO9421722.1 alpha/beta hydrolase [Herminiimonas sp.]MDO9421923.1 alpha/beta hydrolase [Herminiimonas sp.]
MNAQTQRFSLQGAAGALECALDIPETTPRGLALIGHPHPLFGGTMDNKVVHTLTRAFVALGYAAVRMNFRGVGASEGAYDEGVGETDDMAQLLTHMREQYPDVPFALAGFSFGTFVQTQLQKRLEEQGTPAERLVLVGSAPGKWPLPDVPADTILIHGEFDETIPLTNVFEWARPQDLPVIVVPGADHFFGRKLHHIKNHVIALWRA